MSPWPIYDELFSEEFEDDGEIVWKQDLKDLTCGQHDEWSAIPLVRQDYLGYEVDYVEDHEVDYEAEYVEDYVESVESMEDLEEDMCQEWSIEELSDEPPYPSSPEYENYGYSNGYTSPEYSDSQSESLYYTPPIHHDYPIQNTSDLSYWFHQVEFHGKKVVEELYLTNFALQQVKRHVQPISTLCYHE